MVIIIKAKEIRKLKKYTDLQTEVARMRDVQANIIRVIIGVLGSIPLNLKTYIKKFRIKLHNSTLLNSTNVLLKVLYLFEVIGFEEHEHP